MLGDDAKPELLLGKATPPVEHYSPELLYPLSRAQSRGQLGLGSALPFSGWDRWHAYELSWLDGNGCPVSRVGRFDIPADSPCMVESKSLKLYLNSLNNTVFDSEAAVCDVLRGDLSRVLGAEPILELFVADEPSLGAKLLPGRCLDELGVPVPDSSPDKTLLRCAQEDAEQTLYTHLLRSLCPVTGQPDWATLWLDYSGPRIEEEALLAYILTYREHREYHEQCVERIFTDLQAVCRPRYLFLQAFYTRRGGLDINPMRSTDTAATPLARLDRQ